MPQDEPKEITAIRSKSKPYSEFLRPLGCVVRQETRNADHGQEKGRAGEGREEGSPKSLRCKRLIEYLVECFELTYR